MSIRRKYKKSIQEEGVTKGKATVETPAKASKPIVLPEAPIKKITKVTGDSEGDSDASPSKKTKAGFGLLTTGATAHSRQSGKGKKIMTMSILSDVEGSDNDAKKVGRTKSLVNALMTSAY